MSERAGVNVMEKEEIALRNIFLYILFQRASLLCYMAAQSSLRKISWFTLTVLDRLAQRNLPHRAVCQNRVMFRFAHQGPR